MCYLFIVGSRLIFLKATFHAGILLCLKPSIIVRIYPKPINIRRLYFIKTLISAVSAE